MSEALIAIISVYESLYGIPKDLLVSICMVESSLNPVAVNYDDGSDHSVGLCQIKTSTAAQFFPGITFKSLLDPHNNARAAAAYLSYQYRRYNSWIGAVIAYNKGNWRGGLTNRYYRKVLATKEQYERHKANKKRNTERNIRRKSIAR